LIFIFCNCEQKSKKRGETGNFLLTINLCCTEKARAHLMMRDLSDNWTKHYIFPIDIAFLWQPVNPENISNKSFRKLDL